MEDILKKVKGVKYTYVHVLYNMEDILKKVKGVKYTYMHILYSMKKYHIHTCIYNFSHHIKFDRKYVFIIKYSLILVMASHHRSTSTPALVTPRGDDTLGIQRRQSMITLKISDDLRSSRDKSSITSANITTSSSPRGCERCNKSCILIPFSLENYKIFLYLCKECNQHYEDKKTLKGMPLSPRDLLSPRPEKD